MEREKEKVLDLTREQIERKFGKGSLMRLGEASALQVIDSIPTGSLALDAALGIGGVPRGRIVEIYGPESSARPRLRCRSSPRRRLPAVWLPSWTPNTPWTLRMQLAWVWTSKTYSFRNPTPGAGARDHRHACALGSHRRDRDRLGSPLSSSAELEGEMGDVTVGLQARLMSQAMRKLAGSLNSHRPRASSSTSFARRWA